MQTINLNGKRYKLFDYLILKNLNTHKECIGQIMEIKKKDNRYVCYFHNNHFDGLHGFVMPRKYKYSWMLQEDYNGKYNNSDSKIIENFNKEYFNKLCNNNLLNHKINEDEIPF